MFTLQSIFDTIRKLFLKTLSSTNINSNEIENTAIKEDKKIIFEKINEIKKTSSNIPNFKFPVFNYVITCPFGWRILKYEGKNNKNFHRGIDLIGDNYNIIAPEDCLIKKIMPKDEKYPCLFEKKNGQWIKTIPPEGKKWNDGTWGWTPYIVLIGIYTKNMYVLKHCETNKNINDELNVGEIFGNYGNLGYSMGAHCHFEIYLYDEKLNGYDDNKPQNSDKIMKELRAA